MQLGGFSIQDATFFGNFLSDAANDGTDIAINYAENSVDKNRFVS